LAKRMADNPNPSGSALTLIKGAEGTTLMANPALGVPLTLSGPALSSLLHSQRAVRLMTRGLSIPTGARASASAVVTELAALAHAQSRAALPAVAAAPAGDTAPPPRSGAR